MLHDKCKMPVKYRYWCEQDEETVQRDAIVKGFEFTKGQFVVMSAEELKQLEEEATKAIAIEEFVPLDQIDPVYYDKAYFLGADRGGGRAYTLLNTALGMKGLAGIARYAARGKQYIVVVRPTPDGLVMQQLRYADEVREFSDLPEADEIKVADAELKLALQLIEQTVSETFDPTKYDNEVKKRLEEVVHQKVEGQEIAFAPAESPKAQVVDLMEALKASLGEEDPKKVAPKKAEKPRRKRASG